MSIKDLFDKGYSLKFLKNKSQDDLNEDLESSRYLTAYSKKAQRFLPDTDFSTASNFARFGLAEEYYDTAIKRIYQTYPYDGSQAEKTEWENESTYLDLFIFENEYPRTNGYISLTATSSFAGSKDSTYNIYSSDTPQYIFIKGGPHSDSGGDYKSDFSAGPSKIGISKANIYHTASQRTNNLELDLDKGVTLEFWLKKDGWADTSGTQVEYLFHLWNSGSVSRNPLTDYGSLRVYSFGETSTSKRTIYTRILSGSTAISFDHDVGMSNIADSKWHHYALTTKTLGGDTVSSLYVDGAHVSQKTDTDTINAVTGTMLASLGGLVGPLTGSTSIGRGWGNIVSSSFDEFRYWKTERDAQQIGRYYRDQIGGGTNTDNIKYDDVSNKVDLGVYYKFNEGITGDSATDATILDYSGRISNGAFVNYSSEGRNTGSAIVLAGASSKEFKDPIIYSAHPDVTALVDDKISQGRLHDYSNPISLYKSVPGWVLEEDERESNHLKYLMQILASYFDDLYLQIEKLSKLKDINYPDDTSYEKPLPFADRLLEARGYDAPELFAHASALAQYLERDEKRLFEKKLYEVKNIIYQNVYNNLSYIQKSKGTYKSLRNFLRCFGVDEELVKLNIYANNDVYELKDNTVNTALRKKFIDFDDLETRYDAGGVYTNAYSATAYQYKDSSVDNTISYIPAIAASQVTGAALTIEAEVILPKRSISGDTNYQVYPTLVSSIFGMHAVTESDTDFSFASDDTINFNVVINKSSLDKRNGSFSLTTSGSSDILTEVESSNYIGLYDNQKWNLAFRLRPTGHPNHALVTDVATTYTYELYGNNYMSNILQNEFTVSGTISLSNAAKFFTQPKRIFLGSARDNFTGSIVEKYSDVKVSSVRAWYSHLDDETMRNHGKFSNTYGSLHPLKNANLTDTANFLGTKIPQIKTLVLDWNMSNLTGSDANGRFIINDFSSGSGDTSSYGFLTPIIEKNYTGRGDFFESAEAQRGQAIDVEFVQTAKQKLPEVVNSDDMVKILNKQDDVVFTRETTYVSHTLSIEKSMYQTISEEMMRFFASITDFNNLIGEPVNRYRPNYKKLEKLRELFFSRVEGDLDLERFIEYYKWIDDAVTIMIAQLIPASANAVELLRNMVENHVLERNKYWAKFPTLESEPHNPISPIKGIEELKYNWKFGHAPLAEDQHSNQDQGCLWWKQRAERNDALTSGDSLVDADKDSLLKIIVTEVSNDDITLKTSAGVKYTKGYYPDRSLARPWDLTSEISLQLKGGSNPEHTNRHDIYKNIIKWGSDDDFIFIDADNETPKQVCNDKLIPDEINKKLFRVKTLSMRADQTIGSDASGSGANDQLFDDAKSALLLPFSIYSSSIDTGYRQVYAGGSMPKIEFANIHDDKYGFDIEIPMQGPFAEKYVGGLQHRHVEINRGTDGTLTRPEGWHLQEFSNQDLNEYILLENFDGATTTTTTNVDILELPKNSVTGDPSIHEYWRNGVNADNEWTFLKGPTPTVGTGPAGGQFVPPSVVPNASYGHAYCEVLPSKVGQTFSLVTPLIDLLEYDAGSDVRFRFYYHMYGIHIGNLKVQASQDPNFISGVEDLLVDWGTFNGTVISGQQQANSTDYWKSASVDSALNSLGLAGWLGKRFYIRFLYTAGISHLSDCAIDGVLLYGSTSGDGVFRNSFKLLNPTYDNHNRPSMIYTRQEYAKRPVNIRNIQMTGSSPTVAGNYLDRYEYVSTTSPEVNDPWFVTYVDKIASTTANILPGKYDAGDDIYIFHTTSTAWSSSSRDVSSAGGLPRVTIKINTDTVSDLDGAYVKIGSTTAGPARHAQIYRMDDDGAIGATGALSGTDCVVQIQNKTTAAEIAEELKLAIESANGHEGKIIVSRDGATLSLRHNRAEKAGFELPNRNYLTGTTRNRTRFKSRFSSPGGFEVMSRGFLDPAHEIYSVYNAMPWRNNWGRKVYNTQLQAHQGKYGISTHGDGVYTNEDPDVGNSQAAVIVVFTGVPANDETLRLTDAQGTTIIFKIDSSSSSESGELHSDNDGSIVVGTSGISTTAAMVTRLATVINKTILKISATDVDGAVDYVAIKQNIYGSMGDTPIVDNLSNAFVLHNSSSYTEFIGGNWTARVHGIGDQTERVGKIREEDYALIGVADGVSNAQAAKHKYHRNNIERIKYTGDQSFNSTGHVEFFTASLYDNAFVSHMIPRTDQQTSWITASII